MARQLPIRPQFLEIQSATPLALTPNLSAYTKMGVSLSAARYLAPLAFLVDLAAQLYGLLSRPNMKDVHDAHISFFSPLPLFVACFFLPQQIFQAAWLWRLWRANPEDVEEDRAVRQMVDYVPYYAAGNLCIAGESATYMPTNEQVEEN